MVDAPDCCLGGAALSRSSIVQPHRRRDRRSTHTAAHVPRDICLRLGIHGGLFCSSPPWSSQDENYDSTGDGHCFARGVWDSQDAGRKDLSTQPKDKQGCGDCSQPRSTRKGRTAELSGGFERFSLAAGCLSLDRSPQCMGTNRVGPHGCAFRCGHYSSAPISPLLGYGRVAHGLEREHSRAPGYVPAQRGLSHPQPTSILSAWTRITSSGALRITRRASFFIAAWQFSCATSSRIIAGPAKLSSRPRSFLGAPAYLGRFAGYELAKCPGHEQAAYNLLRALYDAEPGGRKPMLITILKELEKRLDVPSWQRINSEVE